MGVSHRSIVGDSNQDYNPSSELELTPRSFAIAKIIKSQDRQEGMQAYNTQKSYRKRSSRKLINHVPVIPFVTFALDSLKTFLKKGQKPENGFWPVIRTKQCGFSSPIVAQLRSHRRQQKDHIDFKHFAGCV
jgi:hypothetical protein